MKLAKLSLPKSKFGKNRANRLNARMSSRQSGSGKSIYNDDGLEKEATSFAEKKIQDLEKKYEKTLKERDKMYKGQYVADDPIDEMYKARGHMLDRKLDRLEAELKVSEEKLDRE